MAALMRQQQDNAPVSAAERAARSVFVGNIPYEATEEQLKEIFQQAGPVVSFRLVYDRETGKPKGYGFCEYQDLETAQSALRNINNYDFNGRPLRVGVAAGEQNRDEIQGMNQAVGGPPMESIYGDPVEPEKAPEAISKAVASLPPEQMFELMKQMKLCIQNNPTEARNMLLQNPQLAYALLQAQIVMKIVDPQVAMAMLHRDSTQIPPGPEAGTGPGAPALAPPIPVASQPQPMPMQQSQPQPMMQQPTGPINTMGMSGGPGPMQGPPQQMGGPRGPGPGPGMMGGPQPRSLLGPGPGAPMGGTRPDMGGPGGGSLLGPGPRQDFRDPRDPRMMGDGRGMGPGPQQMGMGPGPQQVGMGPGPQPGGMGPGPQPGGMGPGPQSGGMGPGLQPGGMGPGPQPGGMGPGPQGMPPASVAQVSGPGGPARMPFQMPAGGLPNLSSLTSLGGGGASISSQDQEKAALIMQVLQLTDQQIAMLPPDQRQSILILKDQISKSAS